MVTERFRRTSSRSGLPTVEVNGVAYHSPYDPQREAQKFYSSLKLEQADVLLQFGWGLGYCGEILRERARPDARVIVFEPDEELFKLSLAEPMNRALSQDSRFQFVVGSKVHHFFDDWGLGPCRESDQFLWVEWPAALREHGTVAEALKLQFKTHLRDRAANLLTHFENGGTYFKNVISNFKYQADADAGRLFGRFRGNPLVIVSAGPSLDRNIQDLRGIADRCFILAVDTAVRPLTAAGVTPHAVIIADPSELNARHIIGAMPEPAYLIAEQAVHPSAMEAASRRFLFGLGLFPDSLFAKFGFCKSRLDAWGSVSTSALDLACRMGANPVIFTGQDFGYSCNRSYASGTIFHGEHFDAAKAGNKRSRSIWGDEIHTTENLIAYRDFFVRRIKQEQGVRFINASEGGILLEGVEILSLRDALDQSCGRSASSIDVRRILDDCYRPSKISQNAMRHLREVLKSRQSGCGCLNGFLELTAKEHLLHRNESEMKKTIQWGLEVISELND